MTEAKYRYLWGSGAESSQSEETKVAAEVLDASSRRDLLLLFHRLTWHLLYQCDMSSVDAGQHPRLSEVTLRCLSTGILHAPLEVIYEGKLEEFVLRAHSAHATNGINRLSLFVCLLTTHVISCRETIMYDFLDILFLLIFGNINGNSEDQAK